jgi:hypothetical protein
MLSSREIRGFFMTRADEAEFSVRLRADIPDILFLDDDRAGNPREIASISEASKVQAWLLRCPNQTMLTWKSLPPLLQFLRCRLTIRDRLGQIVAPGGEGTPVLDAGRMAIVYEADPGLQSFLESVWKVFRKLCTNKLVAYDSYGSPETARTRDIWLGPDARKKYDSGTLLSLGSWYYRPA